MLIFGAPLRFTLALVVAGAAISAAAAQHPGHGMHPLMPDQNLIVRCRLVDSDPPKTLDKALAVRGPMETTLSEALPLSSAGAELRVIRYLPHAVLEQHVLPSSDSASPPAIQLLIQGESQSFERWLVADDPERNRLSSFVATWRYMQVQNEKERTELFAAFEQELTREPRLVIAPTGQGRQSHRIVASDDSRVIPELSLRVRTKQFLPDARMQGAGAAPVNQSARRKNPAAQIELEHNGVTESRWIFAKFPDFGPKADNRLPFDISLDCPIEGAAGFPDFAIVTIPPEKHEAWTRVDNHTKNLSVKIGDRMEIPGAQYVFFMKNFIANAQMMETYIADPKGKAPPAIEVEYTHPDGRKKTWVALRQYRTVTTTAGSAVISLEVGARQASAGHP